MASSVPWSVIDLSSDLGAVSAPRPYTGIADRFAVFKQRIDGTVSVAAAPMSGNLVPTEGSRRSRALCLAGGQPEPLT